MIPGHRLAVLLDQVQQNQINQCLYHNTVIPPSLYYDHACEQDDFPLDTLVELHDHTDEVWYIDFSHDGSMLASASSDNSIIIYDTVRWKRVLRLADHHGIGDVMGVCYVSWSPNDQYLLSCSRGNDLIVYDIKVSLCHYIHLAPSDDHIERWSKSRLHRPFRVYRHFCSMVSRWSIVRCRLS